MTPRMASFFFRHLRCCSTTQMKNLALFRERIGKVRSECSHVAVFLAGENITKDGARGRGQDGYAGNLGVVSRFHLAEHVEHWSSLTS